MPAKKSDLEERLSLDAFIKDDKSIAQESIETKPFVFIDPN